ncbi:MAG: S8/S53 family peptidase [Phycisphaeraceae bacterium]|nr:S8/S53 family peptidase [Phycisphaeraceae bacterium]
MKTVSVVLDAMSANRFEGYEQGDKHRDLILLKWLRILILTSGLMGLWCSTRLANAQEIEQSPRQVIGLVDLANRIGPIETPTGAGVLTSHVEGGKANEYMPNIGDQRFAGVNFMLRSGVTKVGGHAHATAKVLYGTRGLAPGITKVNCYHAANWLKEGCLLTGTNSPPKFDGSDLMNHSWIAGEANPFTHSVLRRLDYLIDTYDCIAVIGVNNGPQTPVPPMLASSYNGIAVGRDNGQSSGGRTAVDGKGRGKPDLVAPGSLTSFCTPAVSACAASMIQLAKSHPFAQEARKAQVIKAVLLAGAVKPPRWRHSPQHPLDQHLGAGVVNVNHSYDILKRDPSQPGMIDEPTGWSFFELSQRDMLSWYWDVPKDMQNVTITVVWHRRIDGRQLTDRLTRKTVWLDTPRMADLDIKLMSLQEGQIAVSKSNVDNVELIYVPKLKAGQYEIQLGRKDQLTENWTAALAWWSEPAK